MVGQLVSLRSVWRTGMVMSIAAALSAGQPTLFDTTASPSSRSWYMLLGAQSGQDPADAAGGRASGGPAGGLP